MEGKGPANGGYCLIVSPKVCLQKTQPDKPWVEFELLIYANVKAPFSMLMVSPVGNGNNSFWLDRWL